MWQAINPKWLTPPKSDPPPVCRRHDPPVARVRYGIRSPEYRCPECNRLAKRRERERDPEAYLAKRREWDRRRRAATNRPVTPQPVGPRKQCRKGHGEMVWKEWPSGSQWVCPTCRKEASRRQNERFKHAPAGLRRKRNRQYAEYHRYRRAMKRRRAAESQEATAATARC